jgi:lipocalin-like protein
MRRFSALLLPAVLLMSGIGSAAQTPPQGEVAKKFFGAWRYIGTWVDGKPRDRGANPKGMIYYDPSGYMSAQVAPDRRVAMAGNEPTGEEAKAQIADWVSYFGPYTIDEHAGTVTHRRVASVQPGDMSPYVRRYEFKGDRLILRPVGIDMEVHWERLK